MGLVVMCILLRSARSPKFYLQSELINLSSSSLIERSKSLLELVKLMITPENCGPKLEIALNIFYLELSSLIDVKQSPEMISQIQPEEK